MVQKLQSLGVRLALVPALLLLSVTHAASQSSLCQKCPSGSDPLHNMKLQIMHLKRDAQALYKSYLSHNGLLRLPREICRGRPESWFPSRTVSRKRVTTMLTGLHEMLRYVKEALAHLWRQQSELQSRGAELLGRLNKTSVSVLGLLYNTQCALCLRGLAPGNTSLPERTAGTSVFSQKIEGCRTLWSYSSIIRKLARAFEKEKGRQADGETGRVRGHSLTDCKGH
ncbi:uncharacterized protein LOC123032778 [Varanus komodoensis]|uniref:uncharacterized protein LOC123032778 n=1 Tax=Varanus komodoensis TaxID=61221 RepID=UPI001CF7AAAB|nr:uncharacterized protein LOC123032778 [Varanus komodoensis]